MCCCRRNKERPQTKLDSSVLDSAPLLFNSLYYPPQHSKTIRLVHAFWVKGVEDKADCNLTSPGWCTATNKIYFPYFHVTQTVNKSRADCTWLCALTMIREKKNVSRSRTYIFLKKGTATKELKHNPLKVQHFNKEFILFWIWLLMSFSNTGNPKSNTVNGC